MASKYQGEYEFNISVKILYPYLLPKGLEKWLAQKVIRHSDHFFTIIWDDEAHKVRLMHKRNNKSLRYLFLHDDDKVSTQSENYLDFKLSPNEMTDTIFLEITDCSTTDNLENLQEVWDSLIHNLREKLKTRSIIN